MNQNEIILDLSVRFNKNLTHEEVKEKLTKVILSINKLEDNEMNCKVEIKRPIAVIINEAIKYGTNA